MFKHIPVEMKKGDCLFFHCNLLHTSHVNTSDKRRWCLALAYNKRKNDPYHPNHHANYRPLIKVFRYN